MFDQKKWNHEYWLKNKERLSKSHVKWKQSHKKKISEYYHDYWLKNRTHLSEYRGAWHMQHKDEISKKASETHYELAKKWRGLSLAYVGHEWRIGKNKLLQDLANQAEQFAVEKALPSLGFSEVKDATGINNLPFDSVCTKEGERWLIDVTISCTAIRNLHKLKELATLLKSRYGILVIKPDFSWYYLFPDNELPQVHNFGIPKKILEKAFQ